MLVVLAKLIFLTISRDFLLRNIVLEVSLVGIERFGFSDGRPKDGFFTHLV